MTVSVPVVHAPMQISQPANGASVAIPTSVPSGPGSISLARITTGHVTGTAFASVGTSYENITTEVITWH